MVNLFLKRLNFTNFALNNKRAILMFCCVLFLALCVLVQYMTSLDQRGRQLHLQQNVMAKASDLRNRIEQQINTTLNMTMGSLVYVASNPDISQVEFAQFAKVIIQRAPYVLNVGLAKDNVITHIYPLAGNKKALGLRYMDNPFQRAAVERAIKTRKSVIAGPVNLVQGGQGFISRIPIFLNDKKSSYWGISSLVVKVDPFFESVKMKDFTSTLAIAIRGKDAKGAQGDVFYGNAQMFSSENVLLPIHLPVGSWELAAAPRDGWNNNIAHYVTLTIIGDGLALLFCLMIYSSFSTLQDLKREQLKTKSAFEQKSRFFTHMTHELRTPLTAIYGSIKLLGSDAVKPNSHSWTELLNNAERNCQRLQWIVNDILDLKKIESGKMEYHPENFLLLDIINEAIDEVKQYAQQFDISIALDYSAPPQVIVNVDRIRFLQVISNLLSNAIKFSPPGSVISINVLLDVANIRIEVNDSGPGVDKDKMESIFNEFDQASRPNSSTQKLVASSGLGLSISKQIVLDHHGEIGCYNNGAHGAVFFVSLPFVEIHGSSSPGDTQPQEDSLLEPRRQQSN